MFLYSSLRLSQRGLREMQLRRYSLPLLIESSSSSWYTGPLSSYSYTSTSPTLRFFDLTTSASRPLANFSPTAATSPSASTEVAVATGDVLTCTVSKGSMRASNLIQPEGFSSLKPLGASTYGSRIPPILLGSSAALAAVLPRASAAKPEAAWAPKERRDSADSDWRSTAGSRSAALHTTTHERTRPRISGRF